MGNQEKAAESLKANLEAAPEQAKVSWKQI